ncbi:MAG TPA: hypothetical protein VFK13_04240 [Gemmatimonadaceae bacterium]|nr:hypothetical protein [Gemmatimonadaceae bacterium]
MSADRHTVLAWSGGKDSTLALAELRARGDTDIVALLTTITADYDRVSVHGVRRSLLRAQAAALALPLVEAEIPAACTNAVYDDAMRRALEEIRERWPHADSVAFGDLFLQDVRAYREERMAGSGLAPIFPVWGRNTGELSCEFIAQGHRATLVCVDLQALDASFAGREYDPALLADLPAGVDPCGERGEFHTFVHASPLFTRDIAVRLGDTVVRDERFVYRDLVPVD